MLGYSIYLNEKDEALKILEYVKKDTPIFTSLHLNEIPNATINDYTKFLAPFTNKGCKIIADISPRTLEILSIPIHQINILKTIGINIIRIDFGFTIEQIVNMNKQIPISLNASTITTKDLKLLKNKINQKDILFSHNFYPKKHTGLSKTYFIKQNNIIQKVFPFSKIQCFIKGHNHRSPLYEGLPTLEEHRNNNSLENYLELKEKYSIDIIIVGDINISRNTVNKINNYMIPEILELKVEGLDKKYLNIIWIIRYEESNDVFRISNSRNYGTSNDFKILPKNTISRNKGSITIDNINLKGYCGEINITKKDLPKCSGTNVIGKIQDINNLIKIKENSKIIFKV